MMSHLLNEETRKTLTSIITQTFVQLVWTPSRIQKERPANRLNPIRDFRWSRHNILKWFTVVVVRYTRRPNFIRVRGASAEKNNARPGNGVSRGNKRDFTVGRRAAHSEFINSCVCVFYTKTPFEKLTRGRNVARGVDSPDSAIIIRA